MSLGKLWRITAVGLAVVFIAACSPRVSEQQASSDQTGGVGVGDTGGGGSGFGGGGGSGGGGSSGGGSGSGGSVSSGGTGSSSAPTTFSENIPTSVKDQFEAPATANQCGGGQLQTGRSVQFPWAPQCVPDWSGNNGGETYRGVYRDRIRVAVYITRDPVTVSATRAAGGCGEVECHKDYANAYIKWFEKYFQMYGRRIEPIFIEGGGSESDERIARDDARRIASIDPPVMAAINGPNQASTVYAEELISKGIMCFCTVSLPQEFYQKHYPMVFSTLMSSSQAYVHRAQYIGQRLARRKAIYAGDDVTRSKNRTFGLVYFDNDRGDYRTGVKFFQQQLARYNVKLKKIIPYKNVEGCQIDATNIINQMQLAGVTSLIFSGDPICPIHLTRAAQNQGATWEWIVTGSALTDTNNFGRLYNQDQWSRAFGVSMLNPDVKNENDYWHKMYKEINPRSDPKEEAPIVLANWILLYTGLHLTGPNVTPKTFGNAMAKAITSGGTPTLPQRSYGPNSVFGWQFWDTTSYDDMAEIWWDPNQQDPNGRTGTYWYVDGGKRYVWGKWPKTSPKVFTKKGAVYGYENPPDQ